MTKQFTAAVAALTILSATTGLAQTAHPMMHKAARHTTAARSVYVCRDCHQYFTPAQAKRLGYKDSDGGKLVKTSRIPMGYTPGLLTKS